MKSHKLKRSTSPIDLSSWDPFTQAKFVFEINRKTGTPVSRREAYETASQATGLSKSADGSVETPENETNPQS